MHEPPFAKAEFETLSHFRCQLRRFLRWSEELAHRRGIARLHRDELMRIEGRFAVPGEEQLTQSARKNAGRKAA